MAAKKKKAAKKVAKKKATKKKGTGKWAGDFRASLAKGSSYTWGDKKFKKGFPVTVPGALAQRLHETGAFTLTPASEAPEPEPEKEPESDPKSEGEGDGEGEGE